MTKKDLLAAAREVLDIEARAVGALAGRLDDGFLKAVDIICRTKARIIVIGMGKSGLVGRKIAATLASCGTPAMFVHPAEAGHGDLGMILKDDVVLAVSYSGETREIIDLLTFFKRIGVKLISLTGNRHSRIARYSDVVIDARVDHEAGPSGLVPTASSTAALAMGDALAIAVMRKKGLGEKDFARIHPKGALGKKLLKVESLMHKGRDIPGVGLAAPMAEAVEEMTRKRLGMTCVLDADGRLAGVITDGDLRRLIRLHRDALFGLTAAEGMTKDPVTVGRAGLATEALNLMEAKRITSLVVLDDDGRAVGIIHLHDLWRTEMF
ncbi:MAG: KpsF/GutQ family sugar-phosphate isomerase [Candidatus Aminicenantes bacterium]|nr:KpsF/GutQ family sugar-phosphate isomerase [Candidatus Aminicenantes bacterium]